MLNLMLKLQFVWAFLGLSYNLISHYTGSYEGSALAPTDPVAGALFILISMLIISTGFTRYVRLFATLTSLLACLLAYSGLYLHVAAYVSDPTLPGYASFLSWAAAVLINFFGLTVLIIGAALAFRKQEASGLAQGQAP